MRPIAILGSLLLAAGIFFTSTAFQSPVGEQEDDCQGPFAQSVLEAIQKGDAEWLVANFASAHKPDQESLTQQLNLYRSVVSSDQYSYYGFQGFRKLPESEERERFNGNLWFNNDQTVCALNIYTSKEEGNCQISELRFYSYTDGRQSIAFPGGLLEASDVPPPPPPPPPAK